MKNDLSKKVLINRESTNAVPTIATRSKIKETKTFLRNFLNLPLPEVRGALLCGLIKDPRFFMLLGDLDVVALFGDLRLLAAKVAQEVKLCTANVTAGNNFNLLDHW